MRGITKSAERQRFCLAPIRAARDDHGRSPARTPALVYKGNTAMTGVNRRTFVKASIAGLSALSYARAADSPNDKVSLAILRSGSTVARSARRQRRQLIPPFANCKDVDIPYICDIDESFFP